MLVEELSLLSQGTVAKLPELKKKKVVLASRLGQAAPAPRSAQPDLDTLKALITALETQSRHEISQHLDLVRKRLLALQEEHQYWLECFNVSFGKFCDPVC